MSSVAKNIVVNDGICSWEIYKKTQIAFCRPVQEKDLEYLSRFDKFNSFYVFGSDIEILSSVYDIKRTRIDDVVVPLEDFSLKGSKFRGLRYSLNYNNKKNFTILDDFLCLNDAMDMLKEWEDTCGEKYFRVRTGKNKYFFKNYLHKEGISLFVYDGSKLIAFGVLSIPNNGNSAYVAGKALCGDYPYLSEFTDIKLYKKAIKMGVTSVNMGGGSSSLMYYKSKFPKAYAMESFNITATRKQKND